MLNKTHRAFATSVATATIITVNYTHTIEQNIINIPHVKILQSAIIILVAWLTASWPDVDVKLRNHNINIIGHRTITHTLWVVLCIGWLVYNTHDYIQLMSIGLLLGYTSHLIGDSFSTQGVAWLYPLTQYRKYPNGIKIVKGKRYIFKPIYKVGRKVGPFNADVYYYTLTLILIFTEIIIEKGWTQ